eukprot:6479912-Amphidinium_carterae.1
MEVGVGWKDKAIVLLHSTSTSLADGVSFLIHQTFRASVHRRKEAFADRVVSTRNTSFMVCTPSSSTLAEMDFARGGCRTDSTAESNTPPTSGEAAFLATSSMKVSNVLGERLLETDRKACDIMRKSIATECLHATVLSTAAGGRLSVLLCSSPQ